MGAHSDARSATFPHPAREPVTLPPPGRSDWTFERGSDLGTRRFQRRQPSAPDREPECSAPTSDGGSGARARRGHRRAESYDDSRRITDLLRANRAVVLATLDVDQGLARRLVDFTAGTAYAMNAKIEMLIRGVYLISPQGMHVGPEMKERLRAANYHAYDQA